MDAVRSSGQHRLSSVVGLAVLWAATSLNAGCDGCDGRPSGATDASTAPSSRTADAPASAGAAAADAQSLAADFPDLGSEEGFRAAHEPRADAGPRRRGADVDLADGRAYLSLPAEARAPLPSVLVIHPRSGLNDHVALWADRLAGEGYAALAVDLYEGDVATDPARAMAMMESLDDGRVVTILREALRWLQTDERTQAARRAVVGWDLGGRWAVELAVREPTLAAAVAYYGQVPTDAARLAELECPLLALFGQRDRTMPDRLVDRFEMGLEQAGGKRYRVLRFDADHAFANPTAPSYEPGAAADAWEQVRAFLREHLESG